MGHYRRRLAAAALLILPSLAMGTDASPAASSSPVTLSRVYVTGYTWFDNTPRGSAAISHPVLHRSAGGTGTYADPITVAAGHTITGGRDVLDLPAGTRLYLPHLQRYGIVEDTCGDGPRPQSAPCHDLRRAAPGAGLWIDVYVGGSSRDPEAALAACASAVTDGDGRSLHMVIRNPRPGYPVRKGLPFSGGRCKV